MLHKDMEELGGKVLRGGVIRRLEDVRIFQMEVNLKEFIIPGIYVTGNFILQDVERRSVNER